MNTKTTARLLSVFAILIILLTACSGSLKDQIVGQWQIKPDPQAEAQSETQDAVMIFSFEEDGAFTIWMDDIPLEGTYTWLDDETIQMTILVADQTQEVVGKVEIEGEQLTITDENGQADILTRVK
jgi:outer membrane biogenesis lipoprotein LolB